MSLKIMIIVYCVVQKPIFGGKGLGLYPRVDALEWSQS
jgi:hypothetical protein